MKTSSQQTGVSRYDTLHGLKTNGHKLCRAALSVENKLIQSPTLGAPEKALGLRASRKRASDSLAELEKWQVAEFELSAALQEVRALDVMFQEILNDSAYDAEVEAAELRTVSGEPSAACRQCESGCRIS